MEITYVNKKEITYAGWGEYSLLGYTSGKLHTVGKLSGWHYSHSQYLCEDTNDENVVFDRSH